MLSGVVSPASGKGHLEWIYQVERSSKSSFQHLHRLTKYKQSGTLPSLTLHFPSIRMTDKLDGFSGLAHHKDP